MSGDALLCSEKTGSKRNLYRDKHKAGLNARSYALSSKTDTSGVSNG
jgi:hypothetical protein